MAHTEGLARRMAVERTGRPIPVPIGPATLGRLFNILGETLDGGPLPQGGALADPAPRPVPGGPTAGLAFLPTGIKVLDLRAPLVPLR
jgi:F-type H+-transporting ATPase subunit beta